MSMGTLVAGDLLRQHRDMVISECFISPIPDVTVRIIYRRYLI